MLRIARRRTRPLSLASLIGLILLVAAGCRRNEEQSLDLVITNPHAERDAAREKLQMAVKGALEGEDLETAMKLLDEGIATDPSHPLNYKFRGLLHFDLGNWDGVLQDLERCLSMEPEPEDPMLHLYIAKALKEKDELPRAAEHFSRAIALVPQWFEPRAERALVWQQLGDYHAAIEDYTVALHLGPEAGRAWLNRGRCYREIGQFERAISNFSTSLEVMDADAKASRAKAFHERGIAYEMLGNTRRAIEDFERAAESDPSQADYRQAFERATAGKQQEDTRRPLEE